MTVDSARPWPKLSPLQRFGPLAAVAALLIGAGTLATVHGKDGRTVAVKPSGGDGATADPSDGKDYAANPVLPITYAEAKKAGTLDQYDWGDRCDVDRGRIMQPSVYAPPCVPKWGGAKPWKDRGGTLHTSNGGATHQGVTDDEIVVAYYIPGPGDLLATAEALGVYDKADVRTKAVQDLVTAGNATFELYGRKVVVKPFQATGDGRSPAAARADARKVAEDMGAFASIGGPTQALAYQDQLARSGVLCISCSPAAPEAVYQELAPHAWSLLASPDQILQGVLDFGAKNLVGKPALFAGDPAMRSKPRVIGIVHYDQDPPIYGDLSAELTARYKKMGASAKVNMAYILDQATLSRQAAGIVGRLKSAGVTSVVFAGDPLMLIDLTAAATKAEYFPEWQITGTVLTDTTAVGRLLDKKQWAHAFGTSLFAARTTPSLSEAWQLFKWYFDREPEATKTVPLLTPQVNMLFLGLHMAGPDLTPDTFAGGLFRYPPSGGGPTTPRISFGNHGLFDQPDYVGIDDFTLVWWDPNLEGPDEQNVVMPGMWRYLGGGKRLLLGDVTSADSDLLFKDVPTSPGVLSAVPKSDQSPDYPPLPGSPAATGG